MKNIIKMVMFITIITIISSCKNYWSLTENSISNLTPGYYKYKKELKKEFEFVNQIIANPERIRELIEESDYYDEELFHIWAGNLNTDEAYKDVIQHLTTISELKVTHFGKTDLYYHKSCQPFFNCKFVTIASEKSNTIVQFNFKNMYGKKILIQVSIYSDRSRLK